MVKNAPFSLGKFGYLIVSYSFNSLVNKLIDAEHLDCHLDYLLYRPLLHA